MTISENVKHLNEVIRAKGLAEGDLTKIQIAVTSILERVWKDKGYHLTHEDALKIGLKEC